MQICPNSGQNPDPPSFALRVFRVSAGETAILRMVSAGYSGLFTHWVRGRSIYCPGDSCSTATHRAGRIWKGYLFAEQWINPSKLWAPVVLEISEHLELDFRHIYARGQIWELSRERDVRGKQVPVIGKVLEERDPSQFPPEIDFLPVLRNMYHEAALICGEKNPLPPRTIVTCSQGDAPEVLREKTSSEMDAEKKERDAAWEQMRARRMKTKPQF